MPWWKPMRVTQWRLFLWPRYYDWINYHPTATIIFINSTLFPVFIHLNTPWSFSGFPAVVEKGGRWRRWHGNPESRGDQCVVRPGICAAQLGRGCELQELRIQGIEGKTRLVALGGKWLILYKVLNLDFWHSRAPWIWLQGVWLWIWKQRRSYSSPFTLVGCALIWADQWWV